MSQKHKHKDKYKHKRTDRRTTSTSSQSLEETGLAYILPTKNPNNLINPSDLPSDVTRLPTRKEVVRKRHGLPSYCQLILMPMFAAMSKITNNLYLTSVGGMTQENFDKYKISCIINATYEAPNLKRPGIESIRVPIDDSEKDDISEFFDQVADKINEKTLEKQNVVVHCVAGISRSTTLVMAYLMKYHRMDLRAAFNHIQARRSIARPNNAFFRQLINYEYKLFGKTSCKMIQLRLNDVDIEVPDFFQTDHKGFIVLESLKQQNRLKKQKPTTTTTSTISPTASTATTPTTTEKLSSLQTTTVEEQTQPSTSTAPNESNLTASKDVSRVADEQQVLKTDSNERPEEYKGMTAEEERRKEDLIKKYTVAYNEEIDDQIQQQQPTSQSEQQQQQDQQQQELQPRVSNSQCFLINRVLEEHKSLSTDNVDDKKKKNKK